MKLNYAKNSYFYELSALKIVFLRILPFFVSADVPDDPCFCVGKPLKTLK